MATNTAKISRSAVLANIVNSLQNAKLKNLDDSDILAIYKGFIFDPEMVNAHQRQEFIDAINRECGFNYTMAEVRNASDSILTPRMEASDENAANREKEKMIKEETIQTTKKTVTLNKSEDTGIGRGIIMAGGALLGAGSAMFVRNQFDVVGAVSGVVGVGAAYLLGDKVMEDKELSFMSATLDATIGIAIGGAAVVAGQIGFGMARISGDASAESSEIISLVPASAAAE